MTIFGFLGKTINMSVTLLACFYVFAKSLNYAVSRKHKTYFALWCLFWAIFFSAAPSWFPLFAVRPILCVLSVVFIKRLLKIETDVIISAFLLSFCVSYSFLIISGLLIGLAFAPFLSSQSQNLVNFNEPVYVLLSALIASFHFLLAYLLFRIKRFKNGFPFLFRKYAVAVALIAAGVVMAFVSLIIVPRESYGNDYTLFSLILCVPIVGAGIIAGIRRDISAFYKRKTEERGIEFFKRALSEKESEIKYLTEQNDLLRTANHKINHRLTAMERIVTELTDAARNCSVSADISDELSGAQSDIKRLAQDYRNEIVRIKAKKPLPSTKIKIIDEIFKHFFEQCEKDGISFNLKINGSIPYMTEHIIQQSKLETLLGDHLQNAIIAVNASDNSFRGILVILGLTDNFYELTVFDSGIPFEIDTLVKLGTERVTTHSDTGGSGIGFMTTFETLRECGASLIISEKKPCGADYSKSITIRFDGEKQYIVETYRLECFSRQNGLFKVVEI